MRCLCLSGVLVIALVSGAGATNFAKVSVDAAPATVIEAINNSGVAAGYVTVKQSENRGLVRMPDGQITVFHIGESTDTVVTGINADATTTGFYANPTTGFLVGFTRTGLGRVQVFVVPGQHGTAPQAINALGMVAGDYEDASFVGHGFVRRPSGRILTFDVPGALGGTYPRAINWSGDIAGRWQDGSGNYHGFVRKKDGTLTGFDAPGAAATNAWGIDRKGDVVGNFTDGYGISHGFIRDAAGSFQTFDAPDAALFANAGTFPRSISAKGIVAGYYIDSRTHHPRGFVRTSTGRIREFNARKASFETYAWAVNDSKELAGQYAGVLSGKTYGFVGTP